MSYNDTQAVKALRGIAKHLGGIARNLNSIADAMEAANKPEAMKAPETYRDALKRFAPEYVDTKWNGGALGCPTDYFRGAQCKCGSNFPDTSCPDCWDGEYKEEEFIPTKEPY